MELPAEVYHDPEVSKKLEAVVLMFCGCRLCGLEGPCVSQTAGDCGELQAMGSLELGLCSGGSSPFFMIFFNFDLLFWNQIFTWKRSEKQRPLNISYINPRNNRSGGGAVRKGAQKQRATTVVNFKETALKTTKTDEEFIFI